jgi:thiamine pyrophosphokinase
MPHLVIGDLDSIGDALSRLAPSTLVESFPRDKDAIDLELALSRVAGLQLDAQGDRREAPTVPGVDTIDPNHEIWIFAALGGRLDQSFANMLLVTQPEFQHLRITFVDGAQRAMPLAAPESLSIVGQVGEGVSILPLAGPIRVRRTQGLRWPLHDEVLHLGSTRGVSNEMIHSDAQIELAEGLALIVHLAHA